MDQFKEHLIEGLKKAKRTVTTIIKAPLKRTVIIGLVIALIIISLGANYDALMDQFSKKTGEHMKNNPVKYNPTDNSILIEEEQIAILEKMLEDLGTSKEKLHLKTENLEKIYAAEVVTQEINRCNTVKDGSPYKIQEEEGKYYGRVYVKRAKETTEDLEDLIYIPFEQFEQLNAEEALKYFSIEEDKLCIAATTVRTDAEGNSTEEITIQKLSYKNQLLPYIMPVEFLLDLTIITGNPEFVMALADKVLKETEIVIAVMQEKETIETQTTYKYKIETETMTRTENYDREGNYTGTDIEGPDIDIGPEQTEVKTETTVSITPVVKIVSVKTWFMEQKFTYNKVITPEVEEIPEDDPSNQIPEEPKGTHDYKYVGSPTYADGSSADIYRSQINRKVDQKQSIKVNNTKEKYEQGVAEDPKEKTEEKIKEFIELLKTPFKMPGSFRKEAAMGDIVSGAGILLQMLQNSERTQSVEHVMRYVLYVYTGDNYGVKELDFDLFEPSEFKSYTGNIIGNTIEDKVWYTLRSMDYSEYAVAGVMGNIKWESRFDPSLIEGGTGEGHGLCQWSFGRKENLMNYAQYKGTTWEDADIQIQFLIGELTPGGGAEGYANYALSSYKGYTVDMWKNASNPSDAAVAFCWVFEKPATASAHLAERKQYAEEYYEKYHGKQMYEGAVDSIEIGGHTFPHYLQRNYNRAFGSSTIATSGCGPTSLAMVLSGLLNNPGITPVTLVDNLEDYYPSWSSYYQPGAGVITSSIVNNNFLSQYYGVKSTSVSTEEGIREVANGKCAIGSVSGHILAIVPVPEQYQGQGYKFYIIDSARGLDGPYRSAEEVKSKPRSGGVFRITYIIEPN